MSAGWLAGGVAWRTDDDCPDCGGPLTETSDHPGVLSIECPVAPAAMCGSSAGVTGGMSDTPHHTC